MQRLRAAFALLFHALLLQATVLGGGMACAPEWPSAVARAVQGGRAADAGHAAHAAHASPVDGRVATSEPAPAPAHAPEHGGATTHCATAAGCAAVTVAVPELAMSELAVIDGAVRGGPEAVPPSTRQAPEPPPPRA